MMKSDWEYRRGDIYLADLSPVRGCEQGGVRPVMVIQNNVGNFHSSTLIVAALSTQVRKKRKQPTHCYLSGKPAMKRNSMIMLEQLRTVDKERIVRYLGKATKKEMYSVNRALNVSLALNTLSHQ